MDRRGTGEGLNPGGRPPGFDELSRHEIDPAAAALLPLEFCLERRVAILGSPSASGPLTVGVLKADNEALEDELASRLGRRVALVQLNDFEIRLALSRLYRLALGEEGSAILEVDGAAEIGFAPDQTPARILSDLVSVAIRQGASDIHVETYLEDVDLRFRVDGVMRQVSTPLSPDNVVRVVSRIKVLSGLDVAERRRPQDGRLSVLYVEGGRSRRVDLRITVLPGPYGQDVAIRILDPGRFVLDLDRLSMPPAVLARYHRLMLHPHGLLLATGPTGSGKTTTLYATLQALRGRDLKIVTVEDPVEYEFPKVNQKNVTPQTGFADYLRAFLRSNPDVILVGEIRDPETAETAVRAATTGHLILSTLHTGDVIGAIVRLRVLGIPDDYLSEVLIGILGQRLVRRICEGCKSEVRPSGDLLDRYYGKARPTGRLYRGVGCARCSGTGYRGLVGVFELLQPDAAFAAAVGQGRPVEELRKAAVVAGWRPLVEDALEKVEAGLTSLEEVARRLPPRPFG